jgi:hypothetical protein
VAHLSLRTETNNNANIDKSMKEQIELDVQELEERIAPSVTGTGGYDGQPGNQASAHGNPSGSATPENKAGN